MKLIYKGVSKKASALLNRIEDYDVEFKESINALDAEDIVAFANSEEGGMILIGVKQIRTGENKGKGEIIGCSYGDREKQKIIDKAENCAPPINIEIILENTNENPFYRIEIINNPRKPYSTSSGTYKIRGDGRKKALLPSRLLTMFAETESSEFFERYKEATKDFEERMKNILERINALSIELGDQLTNISGIAAQAAMMAEDSFSSTEESFGTLSELDSKLNDLDEVIPEIEKKIDTLIINSKIEPIYSRMIEKAKETVIQHASIMETIGHKKDDEIIEYLRSEFPWLEDNELNRWLKEGFELASKAKKETELKEE